jgi:antitoxin MazE
MTIKSRIVRIGNSRGIRVPKALLDQAQLPDEVELHAEPGRLIIQGARRPRMGWAELAQVMAKRGDDHQIDEPVATRFDREEWEWK